MNIIAENKEQGKFTKGEWTVYEGVAAPAVIVQNKPNRHDHIVAICRLETGSEGYSEALANAHLIAAAPDIYKVLKTLTAWLEDFVYERKLLGDVIHESSICNDIAKANQIIAKVEGR